MCHDKHELRYIGYMLTEFTWGAQKSRQVCYVYKDLKTAQLGKPALKSLSIIPVNVPEDILGQI